MSRGIRLHKTGKIESAQLLPPEEVMSPEAMSMSADRASAQVIPTLQWTKFPAEIRLMILEEVQNQEQPLATFVQVSHEWRVFFERWTFGRLVLSQEDIDEFKRIVARRSIDHLHVPVAHIWLRLVLPEYNCPDCEEPESESEIVTNNVMFTGAMWKLFEALALLGGGDGEGITLEFSAQSPSDSAHFFQSLYHLRPDYPHFASPEKHFAYVNKQKRHLPTTDPAHGYGRGNSRAVRINHMYAQKNYARRLVRPLKFDFRDLGMSDWVASEVPRASLPKSPCVTELLIRRQYFRDIETSSLSWLLKSLPSLQRLRRENWRLLHPEDRRKDGTFYDLTLGLIHPGLHRGAMKGELFPFPITTSLPTSLRHLQLFEDFEAQLHGRFDVNEPRSPRFSEIRMLLPSLARSTPNLQSLAVGFLTDAIDVFGLRDFYLRKRADGTTRDEATHQRIIEDRTHHFPDMEFVVLTSQERLRPDNRPKINEYFLKGPDNRPKINALLQAAAAVALKMPKLKTMEIWNCGQGEACIFRYEAADEKAPPMAQRERSCRLTWRSTWAEPDLDVEPATLEAWSRVARASCPGQSSVLFERWPLPVGVSDWEYCWYGDVLRPEFLKLTPYVLHETSAAQVRAEVTMPSKDKRMWSGLM
jgi:hypothetical protein